MLTGHKASGYLLTDLETRTETECQRHPTNVTKVETNCNFLVLECYTI